MGIPGALLAIAIIDRAGSRRLNIYGFLLLALNFAAMGVVFIVDSSQNVLLFALFCVLTFLLNFGPNLGTFVLPAVCFPAHIRSTCHGISAFGGKLGAVVGTLAFPLVKQSFGLPTVLFVQVVISMLGALVSHGFLMHDWQYLDFEEMTATITFLEGRHENSLRAPSLLSNRSPP